MNEISQEEIDYSEKVKKVRNAAASRYGKEQETLDDKLGGEPCWKFQSAKSVEWIDNNPFWWRLDTYNQGVNAHTLLNLRNDCTDEAIETKLAGMDASREYYTEANPELISLRLEVNREFLRTFHESNTKLMEISARFTKEEIAK